MKAIPDYLVDHAYLVHSAELDHWKLVGPLQDGEGKLFWRAYRQPEQEGLATIVPSNAAEVDPEIPGENFVSKHHATAYIQWQALRAVLADDTINMGLEGLPSIA